MFIIHPSLKKDARLTYEKLEPIVVWVGIRSCDMTFASVWTWVNVCHLSLFMTYLFSPFVSAMSFRCINKCCINEFDFLLEIVKLIAVHKGPSAVLFNWFYPLKMQGFWVFPLLFPIYQAPQLWLHSAGRLHQDPLLCIDYVSCRFVLGMLQRIPPPNPVYKQQL